MSSHNWKYAQATLLFPLWVLLFLINFGQLDEAKQLKQLMLSMTTNIFISCRQLAPWNVLLCLKMASIIQEYQHWQTPLAPTPDSNIWISMTTHSQPKELRLLLRYDWVPLFNKKKLPRPHCRCVVVSHQTGFVQAMEFWKNYGILKRKFHIWKNYGIWAKRPYLWKNYGIFVLVEKMRAFF